MVHSSIQAVYALVEGRCSKRRNRRTRGQVRSATPLLPTTCIRRTCACAHTSCAHLQGGGLCEVNVHRAFQRKVGQQAAAGHGGQPVAIQRVPVAGWQQAALRGEAGQAGAERSKSWSAGAQKRGARALTQSCHHLLKAPRAMLRSTQKQSRPADQGHKPAALAASSITATSQAPSTD